MRLVGARVKRVEDPRLITGQSTYVDDLRLVDLLYAAVARSPIAHGRIRGIDVARARAAPGVVAVYTTADLHFDGPLPNAWTLAGVHTSRHDPLCADKVRMVGDPITFVVAESRYVARDAAELVEADYEELPAVVDVERALQPGAATVWDNAPGIEAFRTEVGDKAATEAAFRTAAKTVSLRLVNQRLIPNLIETRGVVARWERAPAADSVVVQPDPAPPGCGAGTSSPRRSSPSPRRPASTTTRGTTGPPSTGPCSWPTTRGCARSSGGSTPGARSSWASASPATSSCPASAPPGRAGASAGRAARCASSPPGR
jgi:hypothetical protein